MAGHFAKVLEEQIEEAFFNPSGSSCSNDG